MGFDPGDVEGGGFLGLGEDQLLDVCAKGGFVELNGA